MESQPQNPEFRNNPETFTHVTVDGFNFCEGPRMCICKVKKQCMKNM